MQVGRNTEADETPSAGNSQELQATKGQDWPGGPRFLHCSPLLSSPPGLVTNFEPKSGAAGVRSSVTLGKPTGES